MAKKQRSTNDDTRDATIRDLFELPDAEGDSKGYILTWAETLAHEAKVDFRALITRALYHFLNDHAGEFRVNPEAFRIPTEAEDDEAERISMAIGYLDPSPERNFYSPGFRPDLALGGWEFNEDEQEK